MASSTQLIDKKSGFIGQQMRQKATVLGLGTRWGGEHRTEGAVAGSLSISPVKNDQYQVFLRGSATNKGHSTTLACTDEYGIPFFGSNICSISDFAIMEDYDLPDRNLPDCNLQILISSFSNQIENRYFCSENGSLYLIDF